MSAPAQPRPAFGQRLLDAIAANGPVCAGIDPHESLLAAWGLPDTIAGLREFSLTALTALGPVCAAVKPQSAFFERHGSGGIAVLEEVIATARELGVLCIVDAKRGDVGSTMRAYAQAYLDPGSALAGDAVTVSPYLGPASLLETARFAHDNGRGIFILALTSNPEGSQVQGAVTRDGGTVAQGVAATATALNAELRGACELGPVGLVLGATLSGTIAERGIELGMLHGAILAPGIGAQGGGAKDLNRLFGASRHLALASVSRSILNAGPDPRALRGVAETLRQEIEQSSC